MYFTRRPETESMGERNAFEVKPVAIMKNRVLISAILPLLLLAGCAIFGEDDDDLSEVAQQRRQWERLGIDTYEYDLTVLCFCAHVDPVRVQVRADTVFSAILVETGAPVEEPFRARTIDELFDVIEDALAQKAHQLDVEYDDTFGYPTRVYIDYRINIADEELTFVAENLHPLRGD